jgi:hypothetical protein
MVKPTLLSAVIALSVVSGFSGIGQASSMPKLFPAGLAGSQWAQLQVEDIKKGDSQMSTHSVHPIRGMYIFAAMGDGPKYSLDEWKVFFDNLAKDGVNLVNFWVSGIFRSKLYPEAFEHPEVVLTTEDIQELIAYAHKLHIKFLVSSGIFSFQGPSGIARAHPELRALGERPAVIGPGLCPSKKESRDIMVRYLLEMCDTFDTADGMYIEFVCCEGDYGHCKCSQCQEQIDRYGTKGISRAEMDFLGEFTGEYWKRKPGGMIMAGTGYECHQKDPWYYQRVKEMNNENLWWHNVRWSSSLPCMDGKQRPLAYFSPRFVHFEMALTENGLSRLHDAMMRMREESLAGFMPAMEIGSGMVSIFGNRPLHELVDWFPYSFWRMVLRIMWQEPDLELKDLKERMRQEILGGNDLPGLFDMICDYYDFLMKDIFYTHMAEHALGGEFVYFESMDEYFSRRWVLDWNVLKSMDRRLRRLGKAGQKNKVRLSNLEAAIKRAEPCAQESTKKFLAGVSNSIKECRQALYLTPEGSKRYDLLLREIRKEMDGKKPK